MGAVNRIKDLEGVLKKYIGNDLTIEDARETSLVASGENDGLILLRADITVKSKKNGSTENLHAVAKVLTGSQAGDNSQLNEAMKKEIAFYSRVVPKLQNFQRQNGIRDVISCFPEFYGGRLNIGNKEGDVDSVLVIENLIEAGFTKGNSLVGYDLETAKLALENLAAFHSVPLAMKLKRPMEFGRHIKGHCVIENSYNPNIKKPNLDILLEILYENNNCLPYMSKMKEKMTMTSPSVEEVTEPFVTLIHGDMWIKNQMVRYDNGMPIEYKMYDFQTYSLGTPVVDLLKFILTSIQYGILETHLYWLLKTYHDCFLENLNQLDCNASGLGWNEFIFEIKKVSKTCFVDILLFIIFNIYGHGLTDIKKSGSNISTKDVPLKAKERVWLIVQEWGRRDWL